MLVLLRWTHKRDILRTRQYKLLLNQAASSIQQQIFLELKGGSLLNYFCHLFDCPILHIHTLLKDCKIMLWFTGLNYTETPVQPN